MEFVSSCALGRFVLDRLRGTAWVTGSASAARELERRTLESTPPSVNGLQTRLCTWQGHAFPSGTKRIYPLSPSRASWASGSACSNCRIPIRSKLSLTRGVSNPSRRRLGTTRVKSCWRNRDSIGEASMHSR